MNGVRSKAFLALGSNLAHEGLKPASLLLEAVRHLATQEIVVHARSSIWYSPAWPRNNTVTAEQPDYANAIVACDVGALNPRELVIKLQKIERHFGRTRHTRWEARTLDLDVIDLEGLVGEFDGVTLPHPRAHERAFVLAPLAEIAPMWRHPQLKLKAMELLARLPERWDVRVLKAAP
jgi:2-amino-4-hydroxy-6-hydroxymethyldihydropteridine diphosphokinase